MAVIDLGRVTAEVDDTLTLSGKAADAAAVGEALNQLRQKIEAFENIQNASGVSF